MQYACVDACVCSVRYWEGAEGNDFRLTAALCLSHYADLRGHRACLFDLAPLSIIMYTLARILNIFKLHGEHMLSTLRHYYMSVGVHVHVLLHVHTRSRAARMPHTGTCRVRSVRTRREP